MLDGMDEIYRSVDCLALIPTLAWRDIATTSVGLQRLLRSRGNLRGGCGGILMPAATSWDCCATSVGSWCPREPAEVAVHVFFSFFDYFFIFLI